MSGDFIGTLDPGEPLHRFLSGRVLGEVLGLGGGGRAHVFEVYSLGKGSTICRYFDRLTSTNVLGKSYGRRWLPDTPAAGPDLRALLMHREFKRIGEVRALGLSEPPVRAVRPYAESEEHEFTIFEEFVAGRDLTHFVFAAGERGGRERVLRCLERLAQFLATLHSRTRADEPVDDRPALDYMRKVIRQLSGWNIISPETRGELERVCQKWDDSGALRAGRQAMIHGDANSTNFVWDEEHNLTVIDFERTAPADPASDLGAVAAELKHLFWLRSREEWSSEPFIRHFFDAYLAALPAGGRADLGTLSERCRFYMGCVELRIGRNEWVDLGHRLQLIGNALQCLRI